MGIFEISGLVIPFAVSPFAARKGSYGIYLVFFGILMTLSPIPLMHVPVFAVTAVCLAVYAVGYKGVVPLSDSLANQLLGADRNRYGRVRVMGSIGFVVTALVMQARGNIALSSRTEMMLWLLVPALLFTLSMIFIPGLLERRPEGGSSVLPEKNGSFMWSVPGMFSGFPGVFWFGMALVFLGFLGLVPSQRFFSLYVQEYLHIDAVAVLWALSAFSEIPFMFFSDRFLKRYGSMRLILFCLGAVAVRNLVYVAVPNLAGAVLGQLFNSVTYGLFHPAAVLFVARQAPPKYMVVGMSLYSVVAVGLAYVVGSAAGGFIADAAGYPALFVSFSFFPLTGFALYGILRRKLPASLFDR